VNEPEYQAAAEALSRMWKARGADAPVAAMRASGATQVYEYRFDWRGEPTILGADLSRMLGAAHGFEIPFVFGHFELGPLGDKLFDEKSAASRGQLSRAMMSYWATFARTGNPNPGGAELPTWSPWDSSAAAAPKFIVLDSPASGIQMSNAVEVPAKIIADVDADARLPTQLEKCAVFRGMTGLGTWLTKADYVHVGERGCADFPWDEYPWTGKK
jgi:para-nitrobenzyl esterase